MKTAETEVKTKLLVGELFRIRHCENKFAYAGKYFFNEYGDIFCTGLSEGKTILSHYTLAKILDGEYLIERDPSLGSVKSTQELLGFENKELFNVADKSGSVIWRDLYFEDGLLVCGMAGDASRSIVERLITGELGVQKKDSPVLVGDEAFDLRRVCAAALCYSAKIFSKPTVVVKKLNSMSGAWGALDASGASGVIDIVFETATGEEVIVRTSPFPLEDKYLGLKINKPYSVDIVLYGKEQQ